MPLILNHPQLHFISDWTRAN